MTPRQYLQLLDVQARMALRSESARYFLGYLWWILEPLLYVLVFYVVFKVILDSRRADFLPFLLCGKFPFLWFSKTVSQAGNSIVASTGLIGRLHVTKTLFPLATVLEGAYRQLVVFAVLILMLLALGYMPGWQWLWLVPIMLVNLLLIIACSLIAAVLVCLARDFLRVIALAMVFLLFVSGIFWDVRSLADPVVMEWVLLLNPLCFLLDAYRQVLMYNTAPDLLHLLGLAAFSAVLALLVTLWMERASQFLAFRTLT